MQDSKDWSQDLTNQFANTMAERFPRTRQYFYTTAEQGQQLLEQFEQAELEQMANIYQAAFAGEPWFEVGRCWQCDTFYQEQGGVCIKCQGQVTEAYPSEYLINEYFPQTLAKYMPGLLICIYDDSQRMVGWTVGGFTTFEQLVADKYGNSPLILQSILQQAPQMSPTDRVFYDNETCIAPTDQGKGYGGVLGYARMLAAAGLGARYVFGRTVNRSWMNSKLQSLVALNQELAATNIQYVSTVFIPEGDSYEVNGVQRFAYLFQRIESD
jgi:hypothetical protein